MASPAMNNILAALLALTPPAAIRTGDDRLDRRFSRCPRRGVPPLFMTRRAVRPISTPGWGRPAAVG